MPSPAKAQLRPGAVDAGAGSTPRLPVDGGGPLADCPSTFAGEGATAPGRSATARTGRLRCLRPRKRNYARAQLMRAPARRRAFPSMEEVPWPTVLPPSRAKAQLRPGAVRRLEPDGCDAFARESATTPGRS